MKKLIRSTGELYFVDADRENRCSIYVCIDYTALDWLSFIFCDAADGRRARKSIRLEACKPMAVFPNHRYFWRTKYWNINEDGYDKILMRLLTSKNSMFPAHTNWERIRILYLKHDKYHGEHWWQSRYHVYEMPDYTDIWGITDWRLMDNDPDDSFPVFCNRELNMAIYITPRDIPGLLVYDNENRDKAKQVAKISLLKPEYLPYTSNYFAGFKEIWTLNQQEKKKIGKSLKVRCNFVKKGGNKWLTGLSGLLPYKDELAEFFPKMAGISSISNFPIPDYSLLPNINPFPGTQVMLKL